MAKIQIQVPEDRLQELPEEVFETPEWELPTVDGGGVKIPLSKLHEIAAEDKELRSLHR